MIVSLSIGKPIKHLSSNGRVEVGKPKSSERVVSWDPWVSDKTLKYLQEYSYVHQLYDILQMTNIILNYHILCIIYDQITSQCHH